MPPRIAIPVPTSFDPEYNDRSWPQYAQAVERAGGIPVRIPLNDAPAATAKLIESCTGVLLPGSGADVNPQKYGQPLHPAAAPPDPARENVDELLLQDAHNMGKPLLAICFGTQILNVWRGGSLIQDLESALPNNPLNHRAGRTVAEAHPVDIAPHSLLATLLHSNGSPAPPNTLSFQPERSAVEKPASAPAQPSGLPQSPAPAQLPETATSPNTLSFRPERSAVEKPASAPAQQSDTPTPLDTLSFRPERSAVEKPASAPAQPSGLPLPLNATEPPPSPTFLHAQVNSSHHQAIEAPGDGLFIVARSSTDGVIEAIEGGHGPTDRDRAFLLGLQWHPERTYDHSPLSRAIFHRLITEAAAWTPRAITTSIATPPNG